MAGLQGSGVQGTVLGSRACCWGMDARVVVGTVATSEARVAIRPKGFRKDGAGPWRQCHRWP